MKRKRARSMKESAAYHEGRADAFEECYRMVKKIIRERKRKGKS